MDEKSKEGTPQAERLGEEFAQSIDSPNLNKLMKNTHKYIIIHHSVSNRDNTSVPQIDEWHKARWSNFKSSLGWYVGYGYIITGNGKVTQTRADDEEQAHTIGWNSKSIGICLTGDFRHWEVSIEQDKSLKVLLNRLREEYSIPKRNIKIHKEISSTECPGKNLEKLITNYKKVWILSPREQIAMIMESLKILRLQLIIEKLKVAINKLLNRK